MEWTSNYDKTVSTAIALWNLRAIGWRGFDALDWVQQLLARYPSVRQIALSCTVHDPTFIEKAAAAFSNIKTTGDLELVRSYFAGKLALEELSCRLNGAGAGACDKRAAFQSIWSLLTSS